MHLKFLQAKRDRRYWGEESDTPRHLYGIVHGKTNFCFCVDVGKWTGEKLRQLGSLVKGLDTTDIKKLGKETFEEAVGVWGKYLDVDMETLEALAEKAKEVRPNRN